MSLIQTPWTSQPQQAVGIDWSNPITRGLVTAIGADTEFVSGKLVGNTGGCPKSITKSGVGRSFTSAAQFLSVNVPDNFLPSACTILSLFNRSGGTPGLLFGQIDHNSSTWAGTNLWVQSNNQLDFLRGSVQYRYSSLSEVPSGECCVVVTHDGNYVTAPVASVNGLQMTFSSISANPFSTSTNPVRVGAIHSSAAPSMSSALSAAWNRALSAAEIRSISQNPWQIFRPLPRRIVVPVATGGGTTAVTADHDASYSITGSVAADASAAYAIRAAVTADATASYALRAAVAADSAASYAIRAAVAADASASYSLRSAAQADQAAAYAIRAAVTSDITSSYAIQTAGTVTTGLDAAYAVRGSVAGDISVGYQIAAAVQAEVTAAYAVRAAVQKDLAAGYAIAAGVSSVAATLSASYLIDGEAVILTPDDKFIARGAARNKTVTAAARRYQIATRSL